LFLIKYKVKNKYLIFKKKRKRKGFRNKKLIFFIEKHEGNARAIIWFLLKRNKELIVDE
jgi:hypothetical protein